MRGHLDERAPTSETGGRHSIDLGLIDLGLIDVGVIDVGVIDVGVIDVGVIDVIEKSRGG